MAHVLAFIPDLLFGSRVQAELLAGGHTVDLVGDENGVLTGLPRADVLVVDLTDEPVRRAGLLEVLPADARVKVQTLAFYSHVEDDVRRIAEEAGFDVVTPRSRMAREGAEMIVRLVGESRQ